jgi:hypothetical protein
MKISEKERKALTAFDPEHPDNENPSQPLNPPPQTEVIDPTSRQRVDEDFNDKVGQTEIWQSFESP